VVWSTGPEMTGYSSAVPFEQAGQPVVLLLGEKSLHAVQVADGKILWAHPRETFRGMNIADPVVVSPTEIFVASGYGYGCELVKIVDGRPAGVWENKNMRNHFNSSVLWEGHIYGYDENNLRCLDVRTGDVKWSEKVLGKGTLTIVDGKLLLLSEKGELLVAPPTPQGFKPLARAQILSGKCWTTPALANGLIYARNAPGDLVCVDVRGG
jgi:outer membrane protein assembly factor BamB